MEVELESVKSDHEALTKEHKSVHIDQLARSLSTGVCVCVFQDPAGGP